MMQPNTPTYYPGDQVELHIEIEHRVNFRWVEAVFRASAEGAGVGFREHTAGMRTSDVGVQERRPDGSKVSVAHFMLAASGEWLLDGAVYELAELRAETVGELAGEGLRGSSVTFDVAHLDDNPRFRYEDEAGQFGGTVRRAELL